MTLHAQEHHSTRRKGCYAIARQRARQVRRNGKNRLLIALIFVWALLTGPFPSWPAARLPGSSPVPAARPPGSPEGEDWPISDYERGGGGHIMRPRRAASSGAARYRTRPTLWRLMADLRRPAARKDAAAALEARIHDPVTRAWASERIAKDEINRLSIWVRPSRAEEITMAAWRGEADAALADEQVVPAAAPDRDSLMQVAKLLEALAGAETVTAGGPNRPRRPK